MRPVRRRLGPGDLLSVLCLGSGLPIACTCDDPETRETAPVASPSVVERISPPPPRALYLPDGAAEGTSVDDLPKAPGPAFLPPGRCPPDMVDVRGEFCIDRYEAVLVDQQTGRGLSPFYHPTRGQTRATFERWTRVALTMGSRSARAVPVPPPPTWQLDEQWVPLARAQRGVIPQGYLNRIAASGACEVAGKRLCTSAEWVTACRGQQGRRFPYGERYEQGRCNVFRDSHPAAILHGNASEGHLDPRLNQVAEGDDPLLRPTGATPDCRSEWGADAAYDMVGNLDEWVSDPGGAFVGGFFARATREGCEARIEAHPPEYFDYSLGVRCCR